MACAFAISCILIVSKRDGPIAALLPRNLEEQEQQSARHSNG
jgi:hypothetical protein